MNERESIFEMFAFALLELERITDNGGQKHGYGSWKDKDNPSLQHVANCNSMFHHLADSFADIKEDKDSGLHPCLHLAWRALAMYEREVRGYNHE